MPDIIKIDNTNITAFLTGIGNGLLIDKPFSKQIYLVDAHIAGTSYIENIGDIEPSLERGRRVNFFREPENPHDNLAIVIKDDSSNKLGYVPRQKNEILSRLMDAGKLVYGTVYSKEDVDGWLKIAIQIYMDD